MNEVKFKAWDKDDKKMYDVTWLALPHKRDKVVFAHLSLDGQIIEKESGNIDLMQSLNFKDKNGKEIYENDIILIKSYDEEEYCIEDIRSFYEMLGKREENGEDITNDMLEVIGNKYTEPKLWEKYLYQLTPY